MNTKFKKVTAVISAAVIALTLSGCADKGSLMTVDGTEIRNGVYINYLLNTVNNAQTKVSAESSENSDDSNTSESKEDFWNKTLEGKDVSEWIKENTLKSVRGHIGVQRLCEQYNIALTDDEISEVNTQCDKAWESADIYTKYLYGFDTLGEMYEARGISLDSYKEIIRVNYLRNKLFLHYYDKEGEYAVPDDEYNRYVNENYAAIRIMSLPYTDYSGDDLENDEDIQAVKDKAREYAKQLNDGEKYEIVRYNYELAKAKDSARKSAKSSYSEDNADGLSLEEYIEKAAEEATYTVPDSVDMYNELLDKANSDYKTEVTDFIMSVALDEKAYVFDSSEAKASYVVVRMEMSALSGWEESYRESVLQNIRSDAFNELLESLTADYNVEQNDYLVNTKYSPKNVDGYVQMK